ncbi:MAG: hypothetical protein WC712_11570 [Candidatus Brocadiia bacterium]
MRLISVSTFAIAFLFLSVACGGGSSAPIVSEDPFVLTSPSVDSTIERGTVFTFTGTMSSPADFTGIEFYFDLDDTWNNGNESIAAYALPAAEITANWDTVAASPGTYFIAVVLYKDGERAIGYAEPKIIITGEELFTLTAPDQSVTIHKGDLLHLEGTLRSAGFLTVDFYLDPDTSWGNDNEFKIASFPPDAVIGDWDSADADVGDYYLAVVLTRDGDRFIGYYDFVISILAVEIPEKITPEP